MSVNTTPLASRPATTPSTILVIEDEDHVAEAFQLLLEGRGYGVSRCADARDAVAWLERGYQPDLILLDLMMPHMDGWEFRVEQRRNPAWASIPVIALSASTSAKAAAIDADAYLRKPVDQRSLVDAVERLLQKVEHTRSQARALELERLSSLGVLTAGIAHEINNPLSFVLGNLELAHKQLDEIAPHVAAAGGAHLRALFDFTKRAFSGAERISEVVRGVSNFARPNADRPMEVDVVEVLESSLQLVQNEIRHRARLERHYEPVPSLYGNPAKLGQVFLNLLINAVHAIDEGDIERNAIRLSTSQGGDGQILVTIADTGRGIPKEVLPRIFDPFFSTKPAGVGMGLGLSICDRLVRELGGTIAVESSPRQGSSFRLTLPSYIAHEHTATRECSPIRMEVAGGRRSRVLVIDDEDLMCDLLSATLVADYDVVTFSDPRLALEHLQEASYDVVLCDLMMPELTGMDLHAELSRSRPHHAARMVFMTGGTFTARARSFLDTPGVVHVQKPFTKEELLRTLREHLKAPPAPASEPILDAISA